MLATARLRAAPLALVAGSVAFGLVELWPEHRPVAYRNDEAFHLEMVQFAMQRLRQGHDPLTSWFSPINLGSPAYLHYQGLPSIITAAVALVVGPLPAFGWSVYLLLALWPISVYAGARLFGLSDWSAAAAAVLAPLVTSTPGVGYEWHSYLWIGWGVWTQLWAMFVMPLAWGLSYQAIARGRYAGAAALCDALVVCLHYLSGYLMAIPIVVLPLVAVGSRDFWSWTKRAVTVGVVGLLLSSWVVLPVFLNRQWSALNELAVGSTSADSFGAGRIVSWLFDGRLFDGPVQGRGRLPVMTVLVLVGLATCLWRARRDRLARALVVVFAASLVAFFGPRSLGALAGLVPGSADLFWRRFVGAVQLAGLLLAGVGALVVGRALRAVICRAIAWSPRPARSAGRSHTWATCAAAGVGLVGLAPAWAQIGHLASSDAAAIASQRASDATAGAAVDRLLAVAARHGGGRVFAGRAATRLGQSSRVGSVQLFAWLADRGVDAVGFTQRTASLMSNPEASFSATSAADYDVFATRWLLLPTSFAPPIPARLVARSGSYSLWSDVPSAKLSDYFEVVDTRASLAENRTDVGSQSLALIEFNLAALGSYPTVAWDGRPASAPTLGPDERQPRGAPGTVVSSDVRLAEGRASAVVVAHRRAVVLLKVSFDPGWRATVDGRPAATEMIAPALVGVEVGPGRHEVSLDYSGYRWYPVFLALSGGTAMALCATALVARARRKKAPMDRP